MYESLKNQLEEMRAELEHVEALDLAYTYSSLKNQLEEMRAELEHVEALDLAYTYGYTMLKKQYKILSRALKRLEKISIAVKRRQSNGII